LGGITAHSQSVNAVCSLSENNGLFATASSDKSIKLWKPSTQKLNDIK
jgi:WD40 repeat protein